MRGRLGVWIIATGMAAFTLLIVLAYWDSQLEEAKRSDSPAPASEAPAAMPAPEPAVAYVAESISTPVPPTPAPKPTAAPAPTPVMMPNPQETFDALTDEDKAAMGEAIIQAVTRGLQDKSRDGYQMTLETRMGYSDVIWVVRYSGMSQDEEHWRAIGSRGGVYSGSSHVFNSTLNSSCVATKASRADHLGPWTYVEHDGWDVSRNRGAAFVPALPMPELRISRPPAWKLVGVTDDELLVSHDPEEGYEQVFYVIHVDKDTNTLNQTDIVIDGKIAATTEYSEYGHEPLDGVHESRADCEARNK